MKLSSIILYIIIVIFSVHAKRYYIIPYIRTRDLIMERSENKPLYASLETDLRSQATENFEHPKTRGRVTIKVYRGPDEGDHAPHGYWVRQPADHY